jgi:hypothetical protein
LLGYCRCQVLAPASNFQCSSIACQAASSVHVVSIPGPKHLRTCSAEDPRSGSINLPAAVTRRNGTLPPSDGTRDHKVTPRSCPHKQACQGGVFTGAFDTPQVIESTVSSRALRRGRRRRGRSASLVTTLPSALIYPRRRTAVICAYKLCIP